MSNTPKLEIVSPDDEPMTIAKPSEFNLDKFKSTRAATMANVETLLNGLPHHKISDAKDFVRLHSNERTYWSDELCFVNVPIKGQKKEMLHLIDEDLALKYIPSGKIQRFRLALATKPDDVLFLCKIPTRNLDNDWNNTAVKACDQAKTKWTQVTSLKEEGVENYKITFAEEDVDEFGKPTCGFDEPTWPIGGQTLEDMILTRFSGFCIDRPDHPALLRLRGKKQANS